MLVPVSEEAVSGVRAALDWRRGGTAQHRCRDPEPAGSDKGQLLHAVLPAQRDAHAAARSLY